MKKLIYSLAVASIAIVVLGSKISHLSMLKELISSNIEALTTDYEDQYQDGHRYVAAERGRAATDEECEAARTHGSSFGICLYRYFTEVDKYLTRSFYNLGNNQWESLPKCGLTKYFYGFGNGKYCWTRQGTTMYTSFY